MEPRETRCKDITGPVSSRTNVLGALMVERLPSVAQDSVAVRLEMRVGNGEAQRKRAGAAAAADSKAAFGEL